MVETRHVRLDYEEALGAKKELLNSQLNLLHIGRRVKAYRILRKKELVVKQKMKSEMTALRMKIGLILSSFPRGEGKVKVEKKVIEEVGERDMRGELDDIRMRLERLG